MPFLLHKMTALEKSISDYTDWSNPWKFFNYVIADTHLKSEEVQLFQKIWQEAGGSDLWNFEDLTSGCKKSKAFIIENYALNEFVIDQIVRAISYQWK